MNGLSVVPLAEKGICISTVSLWLLLVYTEASLRLKDLKISSANLSHLFAAHWYVASVPEQCPKCLYLWITFEP